MAPPRLSLGVKLGGLAALLCALMATVVVVAVASMRVARGGAGAAALSRPGRARPAAG
jgi:hypothetical protein